MSIQELSTKLKGFLGREDVLLAGLVVAVSLTSFALGRVSVEEKTEAFQAKMQSGNVVTAPGGEVAPTTQSSATSEETPGGGYVASKNGTKYHLPWCGSAKQIKEENKIWFATKEEAEASGYQPASNCPGI